MRIACLSVPDFPLAAWLRIDPDLWDQPVAITEGRGPRARVVALSPEAAQRGVRFGISAAQATASDADLRLCPASEDAEEAAQAALNDVARACSPRVEDAGAGEVYLDCEGLHALYGSERELARRLVGTAIQVGLTLHIGVATARIAACLAARNGNGVTIIPQGEEWRFLAPLPVEVLEPSVVLRKRFARWGVRTRGDLTALPADAAATRLGSEGALLARRVRGEEERPLLAQPAPTCFAEAADLDHGVESLEAFGFVLRALLDRLTARLEVRGFICGDLRLSLRLANRSRTERSVNVTVPGNDVKSLLTLVRLQLEAHPPPAPIEAVRIAAIPEQLRPTQLDLFRPGGPAPERLAVILARLATLCGSDRIGTPAVPNSHQPDAYEMLSPRLWDQTSGAKHPGSREQCQRSLPSTPHLSVALRAVRPPQPVEVFTDRGEPDFVRPLVGADAPTASARQTGGYECTGRVVTAAGPWRMEGAWWSEKSFSRAYYEVQLSDGVIYRLFYETAWQAWFVDGVYD